MGRHLTNTAQIHGGSILNMATIGLVSLGCDKNRIDAEQMLWQLMYAGHDIVEVPKLLRLSS